MSKQKKKFNLSNRKLKETSEVNFEPMLDKDITVEVFSPSSKTARLAQARYQNRLTEIDKVYAEAADNDDVLLAKEQQTREAKAEYLADITVLDSFPFEFDEYADLKGKNLVVAAYSDPNYAFIPQRVGEKAGVWTTFLPKDATPPLTTPAS